MSRETSNNVLPFWLSRKQAGQEMCLVTLVGIDGSAPRPLGSQIAVANSGEALGYITGGCAEAAIIAEALDCIAKSENRLLRYGEGSPYKDIALPCGSGIDVYFDTGIQKAQVEHILDHLSDRRPVSLLTNLAAHLTEIGEFEDPLPALKNNNFTKPYTPAFKLCIAGKGPVVPALARLASQSGFIVEVASPEAETLQKVPDDIEVKQHLTSPESYAPASLDPWCAAVTLFHDHEWEPPILTHFLASTCFYVGALGSRTTHQTRLGLLETQGVPADQLTRLRGPVGLDIQASTPTEVAISILAEIIQTHRTKERGPARWVR